MKIQLTLLSLILCVAMKSQSLENIKAHYLSGLKGREIDAVSTTASIQLNLNDGDLVFRDMLGNMSSGSLAFDTVIDNYAAVGVFYEGTVQENINDLLAADVDAKPLTISGTLVINGVSRAMTATCVPIRLNKSSNELYMNFNLVFNPADFNLRGPAFPMTGNVQLSVIEGFVSKIE